MSTALMRTSHSIVLVVGVLGLMPPSSLRSKMDGVQQIFEDTSTAEFDGVGSLYCYVKWEWQRQKLYITVECVADAPAIDCADLQRCTVDNDAIHATFPTFRNNFWIYAKDKVIDFDLLHYTLSEVKEIESAEMRRSFQIRTKLTCANAYIRARMVTPTPSGAWPYMRQAFYSRSNEVIIISQTPNYLGTCCRRAICGLSRERWEGTDKAVVRSRYYGALTVLVLMLIYIIPVIFVFQTKAIIHILVLVLLCIPAAFMIQINTVAQLTYWKSKDSPIVEMSHKDKGAVWHAEAGDIPGFVPGELPVKFQDQRGCTDRRENWNVETYWYISLNAWHYIYASFESTRNWKVFEADIKIGRMENPTIISAGELETRSLLSVINSIAYSREILPASVLHVSNHQAGSHFPGLCAKFNTTTITEDNTSFKFLAKNHQDSIDNYDEILLGAVLASSALALVAAALQWVQIGKILAAIPSIVMIYRKNFGLLSSLASLKYAAPESYTSFVLAGLFLGGLQTEISPGYSIEVSMEIIIAASGLCIMLGVSEIVWFRSHIHRSKDEGIGKFIRKYGSTTGIFCGLNPGNRRCVDGTSISYGVVRPVLAITGTQGAHGGLLHRGQRIDSIQHERWAPSGAAPLQDKKIRSTRASWQMPATQKAEEDTNAGAYTRSSVASVEVSPERAVIAATLRATLQTPAHLQFSRESVVGEQGIGGPYCQAMAGALQAKSQEYTAPCCVLDADCLRCKSSASCASNRPVVLPACCSQQTLAKSHHSPVSGLLGLQKWQTVLKRQFHWPDLEVDVYWFHACQPRMKPTQKRCSGELHPVDDSIDMRTFSINVVGPFQRLRRRITKTSSWALSRTFPNLRWLFADYGRNATTTANLLLPHRGVKAKRLKRMQFSQSRAFMLSPIKSA